MSGAQAGKRPNDPTMTREKKMTRRRAFIAALASAALLLFGSAGAASAAPALRATASTPDYATAGEYMDTFVSVLNAGGDQMSGDLTVKYTFPPGIVPAEPFDESGRVGPVCNTVGQVTECTADVSAIESSMQIRLRTINEVAPDATGGPGEIEVSGGGTGEVFTYPFSIAVGPSGPFAIKAFEIGLSDGPIVPATHAGSDPAEVATAVKLLSEAQTNFDFPAPNPGLVLNAPTESFRDTIVHVPRGFVGDPTATPARCAPPQLVTVFPLTTTPLCPPESQIGLLLLNGGETTPIYNVEPPLGYPAAFAFNHESVVVTLLARLRPSDHGVDIVTLKTPNSIPIPRFEVIFWGDPTDESHDRLRSKCVQGHYGYNPSKGDCSLQTRSDAPFLRTPTSCPGAPLAWSIEMDTYENVGAFVAKETTTPAMEGCEDNPFDPDLLLAPTTDVARAPSGLDVGLSIDQDWGINGLAPADLRSATLTLPEGVSLNPASADGLEACSDAQLRLGLEGPSNCPDAAKLGTVEVDTPLLEDTLGGSVFIRSQASSDPASGELYRLAIELRNDERGIAIRLPGQLRVDPDTGQLTTSFSDLPQLPFESMRLHLKSGARAPLATPSTCGTYAAHAVLTGWNGKTVTANPSFTIDQDCVAPGFDPGFEAGVAEAGAGEFSPFALRVTREAGQPNLSRIEATLPEGELAKLAGVPLCPDAAADTGACPAASRIGHVIAGIGEGSSPLFVPQPGKDPTAVYLAGPYKSAPYSIVASVPAQAGPFDLGTVTVRSAVRVDPLSTRVTVASDPLPQIFAGVPVSYRDVRVEVDRANFTLNPTDCEAQAVQGTIASNQGHSAQVSDRFQVGECAALGFGPRLSLALRGATGRAGHPALKATLRMPPGGANIERAQVALPHSEFLAQGHIRTVCTRVQYAAGEGGGESCPKGSVYGRAVAHSPLLDQPLSGPVYLRSSNNKLPDLVASLQGQIDVELVGRIDVDKRTGGLRTTFAKVPDAPVSRFVLRMPGGRKSLLENSTNICRGEHRATVRMSGQNGRLANFRPLVRARCGKGARRR